MAKQPSRTYNRDAPRKGVMSQVEWDNKLGYADRVRRTIVQQTREGSTRLPADSFYEVVYKPLLDELDAGTDFPSPYSFRDASHEEKARTLQRALTTLSQKLLTSPKGEGKQPQQQQPKQQPKQQPQQQQQPAPPGDDQEGDDGEEGEGEGEGEEEEEDQEGEGEGDPSDEVGEEDEQQGGAGGQADNGEEDEDDLDDFEPATPPEDDGVPLDAPPQGAGHGGGGRQYRSDRKDSSIFYVVRDLLAKLVDGFDPNETDGEGHQKWNGRRVVKAGWNVQRLPSAKDQKLRVQENIYLILDTSGSVSMYAEQIAALAAGAAGMVHIYTGTEARPHYHVPRTAPLAHPGEPFPEWDNQVSLRRPRNSFENFREQFARENFPGHLRQASNAFECDVAWWLKQVQPPRGSRILFWGDTEGCGFIHPQLFKAMMSPYKVTWLLSSSKDAWRGDYPTRPTEAELLRPGGYYMDHEYLKMQAVGIPCFFDITTPEGIRRALQHIS